MQSPASTHTSRMGESKGFDPFELDFDLDSDTQEDGISYGQLLKHRQEQSHRSGVVFDSFQLSLRYCASYYSLHNDTVDQNQLENLFLRSGYDSDSDEESTSSFDSVVSTNSLSERILSSVRSEYVSALDLEVRLPRSNSDRDLKRLKKELRQSKRNKRGKNHKHSNNKKLTNAKSKARRSSKVLSTSSNNELEQCDMHDSIECDLERKEKVIKEHRILVKKRTHRSSFKRFLRRRLLQQKSEDSSYDADTAGFRNFIKGMAKVKTKPDSKEVAVNQDSILNQAQISNSDDVNVLSALEILSTESIIDLEGCSPKRSRLGYNSGDKRVSSSMRSNGSSVSFSRPIVEQLDFILEAGASMKKYSAGLDDYDVQSSYPSVENLDLVNDYQLEISKLESFEIFDEQKKNSIRERLTYENSWSAISASKFNVRTLNYKKLKKKSPSRAALYDIVCCDCWQVESKKPHTAKYMQLPPLASRRPRSSRNLLAPVPDLLVVNIMLPSYPPSGLLSKKRIDGPGHSIVIFAKLSEGAKSACDDPAIKLWSKFVNTKNPKERERLKMITRVANDYDLKLDRITLALLRRYNGVPWLVRPEYEFHTGEGYFEIDIDFHLFPYFVLSQAVPMLNNFGPKTILDCALIIQGDRDDELPERVLACVSLRHLNLNRAPTITLQGSARNLFFNPNVIVKTQQQFVDRDGRCHNIQPLKRQLSERAVLAKLSTSSLNNYGSSSSNSSSPLKSSRSSSSKSIRSRKLSKRVTFEVNSPTGSVMFSKSESIIQKRDAKSVRNDGNSPIRSNGLSKTYSRLKRHQAITVVETHSNTFDVVRSLSLFCIVISTIIALFVI